MVKKILNFIHKESSGLHQAAYFLGIFAFSSQILGLIRDRLLAHNFGAGLELDLYYAAFRLPDFLFVTVASLVSVSVLIPLLSSLAEDNKACKDLINNIFSFFFFSIIISALLVFIFAPFLLKNIFPGFHSDSYPLLIKLTRLLLLSPIFLGLSNLFGSIVQANKRFILFSISPLIYNLSIILGILVFVPNMGIKGVVFGVVIGALLHLLIQLPYIYKINLLPRFLFSWKWAEIKSVLYLSIPRTLALSSNHLALLFLFSIASVLERGSISIFNLSLNLQSVPLSIIGVSYSLAAFPTLASYFSNKEYIKFSEQIITAAKHIIFWSLPIAVLFIVLRAQIVRVILGSGEFSWEDTRLTAAALAIFALSVTSQSLNLLLTRGYYAAQNTKKPLIINIISSILIVIFSFGLVEIYNQNLIFKYFIESLFRVEGIKGSVILMLPFSYTLGMLINSLMLWILFKSEFRRNQKGIFETFYQSFSASIIMGFSAYVFLNLLSFWLKLDTLLSIFIQGFISGLFAILVGIGILIILRNKEIIEIRTNLSRKFWRSKVIGSDNEIV